MNPVNQKSTGRLHGLWALTNRELLKWYKAPATLFTSIIQPIIWIALFGKVMNLGGFITSNPSISPQAAQRIMLQTFGTSDYFSFMSVGMLSSMVLFTTMFSGISIVFDRRLGFLNMVSSTPVSRGIIIFSKVLSATVKSIAQAAVVLVIALLLGLQLGPDFTLVNVLGVFAVLSLMGIGLSSLFLLLALRSTKWETQMAIANLLNLPLMFASNVLFPISYMPEWLQPIARINPVTYTTDAVRQLLVYNMDITQLALDFAYLGVFAAMFATIGVVLSRRYLSK